jgi:hypothetical protein
VVGEGAKNSEQLELEPGLGAATGAAAGWEGGGGRMGQGRRDQPC